MSPYTVMCAEAGIQLISIGSRAFVRATSASPYAHFVQPDESLGVCE
jgi:hypothetical protein